MTRRNTQRLRVLLVPDLMPWITGTIARRFADHNPWIEATVISGPVLRGLLREHGRFPGEVDLVHLLEEHEAHAVFNEFHGKAPLVASVHHVEDWSFTEPLLQADAVHVVAGQWKQCLIERGTDPDAIVRVPNGVDVARFAPVSPARRERLRRRLGIGVDDTAIGFFAKRTSNSSDRKAPDKLLAGLRELRRCTAGRRICAVIVGPGWGDVVRELRESAIRCVWRPFVPSSDDLPDIYRSLDVYWITSRIEGGPVPLLESMACGTPCVTTPVGTVPELVLDGINGCVVPIDDTLALVNRTVELMNKPSLRRTMGVAARQTIVDCATWDRATENVSELYATAIRRFEASRGCSAAVDADRWRTQHCAVPSGADRTRLAALHPSLRTRVEAAEQHLWMQTLIQMGEPTAARGAAVRALCRMPLNKALYGGLLQIYGFRRVFDALVSMFRAARASLRVVGLGAERAAATQQTGK